MLEIGGEAIAIPGASFFVEMYSKGILALVVKGEDGLTSTIPACVRTILDEFKDIILEELPAMLPPMQSNTTLTSFQ